jgi:hypothetical protein
MGAHPFRIQSTPNGSTGIQYNDGIVNNDVSNGTLTWNVQFDAPGLLYYQCTAHGSMGGKIYILNSEDNVSAGTAAAPSISPSGDSNTGIFFPSADTIAFAEGGAEAMRIDSSSRLLVGTSTNIGSQNIQIGTAQGTLGLYKFANNDDGGELTFGTSRNGTIGSQTIVNNNDFLGRIFFRGSDGSAFFRGAEIACRVDGTPGANDMPGRIVLSTTAAGASSPTERMRITKAGTVTIFNSSYLHPETDNAVSLGLTGYRWSSVWAVNGSIQTSDQRAKTDISNATLGSDFIKSLRPVSYKWIEGGKRDTGERDEDNNYIYESVSGTRTHWGFIAQEVKQAVDDAGVDFGGWVLTDKDDPDSQQALRYDQFIAPLTKALQEALAEIKLLKAKVAALETA